MKLIRLCGVLSSNAPLHLQTAPCQESLQKNQTVVSVQAYPTQSDKAVMLDPNTHISVKANTIVERFRLGGLGWPSESTIKDITALLASEHWQQGTPDAAVLSSLAHDIKKLFHLARDSLPQGLPRVDVSSSRPRHVVATSFQQHVPVRHRRASTCGVTSV